MVVTEPPAVVYGVLWTITEANERSLDQYEGDRAGICGKTMPEVETSQGESLLVRTDKIASLLGG